MKVLLRVVLLFLVCSITYGAYIGNQFEQQNLKEVHALPKRETIYDTIRTIESVYSKFFAITQFMKKYNAINRFSTFMKFILPKFKAGRKILAYYNKLKGQTDGSQKSKQAVTFPAFVPPIYFRPPPPPRFTCPHMRSPQPRQQQTLEKPACNCFKDQARKYNYFQNRRRNYQRKIRPPPPGGPSFYHPIYDGWRIIASLYPPPQPTTLTTKGLSVIKDLLPDPKQIPYYANMALDVIDNNFDSWNAKAKSLYNAIVGKFSKNTAKNKHNSDYDAYTNSSEHNLSANNDEYDFSYEDNSTYVYSDNDTSANISSEYVDSNANDSYEYYDSEFEADERSDDDTQLTDSQYREMYLNYDNDNENKKLLNDGDEIKNNEDDEGQVRKRKVVRSNRVVNFHKNVHPKSTIT